MLHYNLEPREFQLTLLATSAVEGGSSVGKLKRNAQPLFRSESPGFVNLLLCQHVAKLTGTSRSIQTGKRGCGFRFHSTILHGNDMPVTTQAALLVTFHTHTSTNQGATKLYFLRASSDHGLSHPLHLFSSSTESPPNKRANPLVRVFPEFVTDPICAWLIERAQPKLQRALIYDPVNGKDMADHMRTNSAAGFDLMQADVVQVAVQSRMSVATGVPLHHMARSPTLKVSLLCPLAWARPSGMVSVTTMPRAMALPGFETVRV